MVTPKQILWSLTGLLLTICGTFLQAYFTTSPWNWSQQGVQTVNLGVTYQIGAVLLVSCLGGKTAGVLSQIAYILLGLTWLPVFTQGGGVSYLNQPYFGYILGFIPGAWVCGFFAFRAPAKLESLGFSCLCGLLTIHLTGLSYLVFNSIFNPTFAQKASLLATAFRYSIYPLPAQLIIVCTVAVLSYLLRHLMFY